MPINVIVESPSLNSSGASVVGGSPRTLLVRVINRSASPVSLNSLSVSEPSGACTLSQPVFLTPNAPINTGRPVLAGSGGTGTYTFSVSCHSPTSAGPSPQAPGGAAPENETVSDGTYVIRAEAVVSDGSYGNDIIRVWNASAVAPFPPAYGGALQLDQGANLINYLYL